MGAGDHHCGKGQAQIATEKARDKHDLIIVQKNWTVQTSAWRELTARFVR